MNETHLPRRIALQQLASVGFFGALGLLRSRGASAAASPGQAPAGAIPDVTGTIVRRGDASYEEWRTKLVWHHSKADRYPDVIVQVASEDEVAAVIRHAAQNKLKVAVRGGGHHPMGPSVRDGGICLDLSGLNDIQVDAARQIASVQPGVRAIQLVAHLAQQDLTFPTAHCPTVGMGGFLLGGGIGWNHPYRSGVATLNIEAADLVLADGSRVKATADENAELLWAVRGGGPGLFAAVTRFHLKAYPLPKDIRVSTYILPLEALGTMTETLEQLSGSGKQDPKLEILALLMHNPEAPPDAPPEKSKICLVAAFAFGYSAEESRAMLAPLMESAIARAAVAKDEDHPYTLPEMFFEFFSTSDPGGYQGRYAAEGNFTDQPGKILHELADHFRRAPSPICHVISSWGLNLEPRRDACFSGVGRHYIGCFSIWDDPKDDERGFQWLEQATAVVDPRTNSHYPNEISQRHPERIRLCYTEANWKRLRELRAKYDPQGVFYDYLGLPA